ncbi:MAG: hypothetical protein AABZ57_02085, partial [Candidatus Margulisiibacteriota bacterium]
ARQRGYFIWNLVEMTTEKEKVEGLDPFALCATFKSLHPAEVSRSFVSIGSPGIEKIIDIIEGQQETELLKSVILADRGANLERKFRYFEERWDLKKAAPALGVLRLLTNENIAAVALRMRGVLPYLMVYDDLFERAPVVFSSMVDGNVGRFLEELAHPNMAGLYEKAGEVLNNEIINFNQKIVIFSDWGGLDRRGIWRPYLPAETAKIILRSIDPLTAREILAETNRTDLTE